MLVIFHTTKAKETMPISASGFTHWTCKSTHAWRTHNTYIQQCLCDLWLTYLEKSLGFIPDFIICRGCFLSLFHQSRIRLFEHIVSQQHRLNLIEALVFRQHCLQILLILLIWDMKGAWKGMEYMHTMEIDKKKRTARWERRKRKRQERKQAKRAYHILTTPPCISLKPWFSANTDCKYCWCFLSEVSSSNRRGIAITKDRTYYDQWNMTKQGRTSSDNTIVRVKKPVYMWCMLLLAKAECRLKRLIEEEGTANVDRKWAMA